MIETHPYLSFVPKNSKYLLLGSYPAKNSGDWFYGSGRNQFWRILEQVYGTELVTRKSKEQLFTKLKLAVSDIIYSCERKNGNSLDNNLINITYNHKIIEEILANNKIQIIYFTSKFVENRFRKIFKYLIEKYPEIELVTLPSPSPRYALISKEEKIKRYKELMPITH
jgi:hypoxanthine-DNA glycosylase